jgi:site-specific recombinase XerD
MLTIAQNMQNLKYKVKNRKLPVVLEPEEVARLLSIPNKRFISGLRNKARKEVKDLIDDLEKKSSKDLKW